MSYEDDIMRSIAPKARGVMGKPLVVLTGWQLRPDGDIQSGDNIYPLEEFVATGQMGPDQIKLAREMKRKAAGNRV